MSEDSTVKHAVTELGKEGVRPCRQTVWRFWVHYRRNKTTKPLPRSGRPTKLTERVQELIEQKMQSDDETTVKELALLIRSEFGYLSTRCRKEESYLAGHLVGRPTAS